MKADRLMKKAICFNCDFKALLIAFVLGLSGCSVPKGALFYGALGKGESVVIIANGVSGGAQVIAAYSVDGRFLEVLADTTYDNLTPKGVAKMDPFNFVAVLDGGSDLLGKVSTLGGYTTFVSNSNLNGTLYQVDYHQSSKTYYVIEGNAIEGFDSSGNRLGVGTNPVIGTTVGACTLATPRGIAIDQANNRMFVTSSTGTTQTLSVYDLTSPSSPTCLTANATMGNSTAVPVIVHSNGTVYSATQLAASRSLWAINSDGTGAATAVYTDAAGSILNAPTAMAELPDGTILVANQGRAQIDRFNVNGKSAANRYGTTPFIKDAFTTNVNQILVIRGM